MRLRITSFSFVLLLCAVTLAHPVSHTDAWVKVSDTSVSVRLLVFLDDVVRHQSEPEFEATELPSSDVQAAIQRHSAKLLKQLQIFDQNGRPMTGTVVSEPRWQPTSETVDLTADSMLKLKWNLKFDASEDSLSSLTFLHQMTHPSLPEPGELRLHLQHTESGRRIDTVIPPDRPHTILLPREAQNTNSEITNPNLAVSRIIVAPTGVAHEFTAPLALVNAAWRENEQVQQVAAAAQGGDTAILTPQEAQEVRKRVVEWFQNQTSLSINGRPVTQTSILVDFLPSESVAIAGPEPVATVDQGAAVPLMGTQIGVQVRYPGTGQLQSLELNFSANPGLFSELTAEVVSARAQVSELVEFRSDPSSDSAPSFDSAPAADSPRKDDRLTFRWEAAEGVELTADMAEFEHLSDGSLQDQSSSDQSVGGAPVTVTEVWPSPWGLWLGGLVLASTLVFCVAAHRLISRSWLWRCGGFGLLIALVISASVSERHVVVHDAQAARLIQKLLQRIYVAAMQPAETVAVAQLSQVLHEDLVEQVYLDTLQSLSGSSADGLLIDIQAVELESQHVLGVPEVQDQFTSICAWRVRGRIHHWGHTHVRELLLQGRIGFFEQQGHWKIQAVEQLETNAVSSNPRKTPS